MKSFMYNGEKLTVDTSRTYENGRKAIQLLDAEDGMPYMVATVNIPEIDLAPDDVCIKNYSENAGILQALIDEKIIGHPHFMVPSGHAMVPVCKLLI